MRTLLSILFFLSVLDVQAGVVEPRGFDEPADEARYKRLIAELRCLVCQNQNLADSNAELATDLRNETYSMVKAGKTDEEIVTFMVNRYGDFVLYRPPVKSTTFVLWFGPLILAALGGISSPDATCSSAIPPTRSSWGRVALPSLGLELALATAEGINTIMYPPIKVNYLVYNRFDAIRQRA